MTKYEYSREFINPAPIVEVEVTNPYKSRSRKLKGKIDTAADISAIPDELISELELEWSGSVEARGFNQKKLKKVKTYRVNISFANRRFEHIEVIPAAGPFVLIGRNVLNQLKILLNGKNLKFKIL